MVDEPAEMVPCTGSSRPTDVVDDMTIGIRSYMCADCGAAMDKPLATSHPSRLD